ncbi:hypothetical protein SCALM49S_03205 [Streptomyces californicus]
MAGAACVALTDRAFGPWAAEASTPEFTDAVLAEDCADPARDAGCVHPANPRRRPLRPRVEGAGERPRLPQVLGTAPGQTEGDVATLEDCGRSERSPKPQSAISSRASFRRRRHRSGAGTGPC